MTIKELELELGQFRRVLKDINRGRNRSFTETESLRELLPYINKQIDYNLRRTEEKRLQGTIKASENGERFMGGFLQKISVGTKGDSSSGLSAFRAWIESLERERESKRNQRDNIWQSICELAPRIRPLVERMNLPSDHILLRTLPQPPSVEKTSSLTSSTEASAAVSSEKTRTKSVHKGRPQGEWSAALDVCVEALGRDVKYQAAAEWLCYHYPYRVDVFYNEFGNPPPISDKQRLVKLLKPNEKINKQARKKFHNQLNKAKKRLELGQIQR
jgi:hypothetical protein